MKVDNGFHAYESNWCGGNIVTAYIGGRVGLSTTSITSLREHK